MKRMTEPPAQRVPIACSVVPGVLLALVLGGCDRDGPSAPEPPAVATRDVAGLAVAIRDVQSRIVPTLGSGAAAEALGSALRDVERTLFQTDAAVHRDALGRALSAAAQLGAEASRRPDVDVVLLVLERITAVARDPAEPVPGDAQPTAGHRREQ